MSVWRHILSLPMPKDVKEQMIAAFENGRTITMRAIDRGNGKDFFIETRDGEDASSLHCSTCQCPNIHAEMPSHPMDPKVKRTKSWHSG